jgi:Tol biopolymer transport system component
VVAKVLAAAGTAIAALAIAILSVPAIRHLRERPPDPPSSIRLSLSAPAGAELGYWDQALDAAISPDERQIAFVATKDGTTALWRRALDEARAQPIAGTEGAQQPAWKSTGNVIAFFAGERLRQVSLPDGEIRDLAVASGAGASWLPDGSLLFGTGGRSPIQRLRDGAISEATTLRPNEKAHIFPMATARTDSFVYTAILADGRRTVRLVSDTRVVSDRADRELATTTGHGQLVGNVLLYARDQVLVGQRLNAETLLPEGRAIPLALDVGTGQSGATQFAASPRLLITAPPTPSPRQLTWLTFEGARGDTERDPGDTWQVRLSPDDQYAAVTVSTPLLRTLDVEIIPMFDSAKPMFRTRAVAADSDPVWSPDGRRVIFRSLQDGTPKLFTNAALVISEEDAIVPMSKADETPTDWRGDRVLAHAPGARGDFDLVAIDMATGARTPVVTSQFNDTDARLSPDGRWMAYVSDESGAPDIYAQPQPGGQRVRVSFGGGTRPRWGRAGRTLFFLRGARIMRSDVVSAGVFGTARVVIDSPGIRDFDVAHRRDALLALIAAGTSPPTVASVVADWRTLVN